MVGGCQKGDHRKEKMRNSLNPKPPDVPLPQKLYSSTTENPEQMFFFIVIRGKSRAKENIYEWESV